MPEPRRLCARAPVQKRPGARGMPYGCVKLAAMSDYIFTYVHENVLTTVCSDQCVVVRHWSWLKALCDPYAYRTLHTSPNLHPTLTLQTAASHTYSLQHSISKVIRLGVQVLQLHQSCILVL